MRDIAKILGLIIDKSTLNKYLASSQNSKNPIAPTVIIKNILIINIAQ